ncbi:MAG: hypothetical protein HQ491_00220 [Bacteroidetes bacterium]|nr:hypothetical protein [Bacteroidota bacterium]
MKRKKEGRVDYNNTWNQIKSRWLDAYRNKETVRKLCLTRKVSHQDEWCAEAYMQTNYSELEENEFKETIKKYLVFNLLSEQSKGNRKEV